MRTNVAQLEQVAHEPVRGGQKLAGEPDPQGLVVVHPFDLAGKPPTPRHAPN